MDRNHILADFQACTGITDMGYCISVLESHNWDLTAAVASSLADGVSDATLSHPANFGMSYGGEHHLPPSNTTECQTMLFPELDVTQQIPPSDLQQGVRNESRFVIERDAGAALSSGSIRQLHFDIQLELPPEDDSTEANMCEESFIYPETETVGSLKRHFIDLKLAELISLATLPEWTSVITNLSPQSLLSHLSFESSSGHNFNDHSAILRSLHLPTFNSVRAKLVPHTIQPTDLPTCAQGENEPNQIKLRIYVNLDPSASEPLEYRSYSLCLQPTVRANQVRREAASLTGIAANRQIWSAYVPTGSNVRCDTRNPPVERLISELNRRRSSVNACSDSKYATLDEIGLQTDTTYKIQLAECIKNKASTSRVGNACSVNSFKSPSPKQLDQESSIDLTNDLDDEDGLELDDDLMEDLEPVQQSIWSTPLIPDSSDGGDPTEATEQFCASFIQRYCGDGETMSPPFLTGSLDSALASTVLTASVNDRKPLFIYLHDDKSVACHVFCQQILCSIELGQFFGENDFSIWPWDITRPRSKERLFGWLENKAPNLVSNVASLHTDSYPVLAMVGKVAGQIEVLCIVLGTGAVSGLLLTSSFNSDFPPISSLSRPVLKPFPDSTSGSLKPDIILAELWQAYTTYQELLAPERAAEAERVARQRVRLEQEKAFQESLRLDRLKAENAERERERQALLERERLRAKQEASQRRLQVAATLPSEPPAPNTPAAEAFLATPRGVSGIASLRFRLPQDHSPSSSQKKNMSSEMVLRRFAGSDTLRDVFAFVESKGFPVSEFKLLTTYPRRDLSTFDENATMVDLGLVPQETLILEYR